MFWTASLVMMRIHEVLLEVSRYNRRNRDNRPSWLPENWDVCLDEDELRVFYEYALDLWQNGVDLADPYVQQVIEGNYQNN